MSFVCCVCKHVVADPMVTASSIEDRVYHIACINTPVVSLLLTDSHNCSLCRDKTHTSTLCVGHIVKELKRLVLQTIKGIKLNMYIEELFKIKLAHIQHPKLCKLITRKIIDVVAADPQIIVIDNDVFSIHVSALKKINIPQDGNWHEIVISPAEYLWLSSVTDCTFRVQRHVGRINARYKTTHNIDTVDSLNTILKRLYPRGIQDLELYREHADMAMWLISDPSYVFLESDKGGNVVFIPDLRKVAMCVARDHGIACGMLFDMLHDKSCFDFELLPQIHPTLRYALIKDLLIAKLVTCAPGYINGSSMFLSVNKTTVASLYPDQMEEDAVQETHISETNIDIRRRRRDQIKQFCRAFSQK
jgi:hypothetical protein